MINYAHMYYILCAAASAALDILPANDETAVARILLKEALDEAEDLYIEGHE